MLVLAVGCSDDPVVPQTGTITVNPESNSVNAPWQIQGPGGFNRRGQGDATIEGVAAGTYMLTWG